MTMTRNRWQVLALLLGLFLPSLAFAAHHKVAPDLQNGVYDPAVDVIIQFRRTPTHVQRGKVQKKGGVLRGKLDAIKGALYSLPVNALEAVADDPDVVYISPDRPLSGASTLDYTPETVNAPVAWNTYGLDGTGIGVALIDSGIYPVIATSTTISNPDLIWVNLVTSAYGPRLLYSQSFVPGTTDTSDYYGHGTHVAGIVSGAGWNSYGNHYTHMFKGIAPNANLINLRALDQNGAGTDSSVIAAIQAAISLKSTYNIRVLNLSLGRQVYESYKLDPLCQAVEAAWNAGIVVVVAAGNEGRNDRANTDGYGTIAAPGNDPYVISVGAMKTNRTYSTTDDTIASYSSKGPTAYDYVVKPDLVAPGNRVVSDENMAGTLPTGYAQGKVAIKYYKNTGQRGYSNQYYTLSGTSMATPVVSGAVALLLQQNPNLTPDQLKARLMKTDRKSVV